MKAHHFMQNFINPSKTSKEHYPSGQSKLLKTNFEINSMGVIRMKESTLSPTLHRVNSGFRDPFMVGRGAKNKKDRSAQSSKHGSFIAAASQQ